MAFEKVRSAIEAARRTPHGSPFAKVHAAAEALGGEEAGEAAPEVASAVDGPPSVMHAVRFEPERRLLEGLFERFGLEDLIAHFEESGGARSLHDVILGTHIRLTPLVAPRLYSLFDEVRTTLGFTEPVDLFVIGDADINASAFHAPADGRPHAVALTSGAVERMTDDELRFVFGHELGHIAFGHCRAQLVHQVLADEEGMTTMPALLYRRLESFTRLAELSVDRVGFLAAGQHLDTAVSVFFKLTAGLGPEHLRFDIAAFLEQLAELQNMPRSELLARFSHPITPVRVRALQLFSEAGGRDLDASHRGALDAAVAEVAQLMELQVTEPNEIHARDFLIAAGLLGVYADAGEPSADQRALLVEMLLPLTADPEDMLDRITSTDAAELLLIDTCVWLRENAGEERFELYTAIVHVVCADGDVSEAERTFLLEVATLLGIPAKVATDTLYEVLREYLQERATKVRPAAPRPEVPTFSARVSDTEGKVR